MNRADGESMSGRFPLTAIVLTCNEAANIGPCLRSLAWVDDAVIVDSGSTDGTIEAARAARPDVRVLEHPFEDFGQQRNWALDHAEPRHDWILFFDADERSNDAFAEAVQHRVNEPGGCVGFYLCYRNFFLGRWLKRCTLYPSWQLRLLRQGEVRYRKEGHGQREVTDGPLDYVHVPYDHYGFSKGVAEWIERHNRYSTNEVDLIREIRREPLQLSDLLWGKPIERRRCLKRLAARMGFRPVARFVYLYVLRRGFLDGRAGLLFCLLRTAHEMHITVKLAEAERAACEAGERADDGGASSAAVSETDSATQAQAKTEAEAAAGGRRA